VTDTPVAALCSSTLNISELVKISKRLAKGQNFILLLKKDQSLLDRLLPSYLNASLRISENNSKSENLSMEMLLFIAGTLRVDKAIKECGAYDKSGFIVFASTKNLINRFAKEVRSKISREYDLKFDIGTAQKVASTALLED
jgi:hypothetical protein